MLVASIYAFASVVSLQLMGFVIKVVPSVLRRRIEKLIGVDYDR